MSETVDRRVVEMRFDNKDFEKNSQATMTALEKLKEKMSFKDSGKNFESSGLASAVDNVKSRFSALEVVGVAALVNLTNSAINLGKNMLKSLTIDQVTQGFSEYELKMGSVQTIMAGTGESVQTVGKYLDELNHYADKTIYSFSDMTQNIGKFTNAGISLKDSTAAIQGVSNVAALAGANANEASRAMYNFSQALSTGSVKLIDWKSIENANMATKGFKQQLIDTAVALGTVKKEGDKYVATTSKTTAQNNMAFTATEQFNNTLSAEWMTTEVLTQTLQNYSHNVEEMTAAEKKEYEQQLKSIGYNEEQIKQIEELGTKAFAAATEVKTFHQLLDTMKEAVGSGWAETFETIFGNFEEAKKLWTSVNNEADTIIGGISKRRNDLLEDWKELGGRDELIGGFANLYKAMKSIITPIKEAFNNIFPPTTAKQLESITKGFQDFTSKLIISEKTADSIREIFTLLFSVLKTGKDILSFVVGALGNVASIFLPIGSTVVNTFGKASEATNNFNEAIRDLSKGFSSFAGGAIEKVANTIAKIFTTLANGIKSVDLGKAGVFMGGGGVLALMLKLKEVLEPLGEMTEKLPKLGGIIDNIKGVFGTLTDTLGEFQNTLKAKSLMTIATAVAVLAGSCFVLSTIPIDKLASATIAIGALMGELVAASYLMKSVNTKGIVKVSAAISILALAVKTLAGIEDIQKGLNATAVLLTEVGLFCYAFTKLKIKPRALSKTADGLILMAVALNLMVKPVKTLGSMDGKSLAKGLGSVALMLGSLVGIALIFSKLKVNSFLGVSASLVVLAVALNMMVKPVQTLGKMKLKEIGKGLLGLGGILAEVIAFSAVMSTSLVSAPAMMVAATALTVMSVGINLMSVALMSMGGMKMTEIGKGLLAMGGALAILATAMHVMQTALPGAAAMVVVAGALAIMAPPIIMLSQLNLTGVGVALLALGGSIVVFAGAALLLAPAVPLMVAMAAAMALNGAGMLAFGAGLALAASGLGLLITTITSAADVIGDVFPKLGKGIADGLNSLLEGIADAADNIKESVIKIGEIFLDTLNSLVPYLIETGLNLFMALLRGIKKNIKEITALGLQILVDFVDAISANIQLVTDAAANLVISFINSVANTLSNKAPELNAAVTNLVLSVLEVIASAIPIWGDKAAAAVKEYREGLQSEKKPTETTAKGIADSTSKNLKIKDQKENGRNAVRGLSKGMSEMKDSLRGTASTIAGIVDSVIRKKNEIKSPSRRLARTGKYMMQGLIGGLDSLTGEYQRKADNIATYMLDSVNSSANGINSAFNQALPTNLDFATSANIASNMKIDATGVVDMRRQERLFEHMNQLMETLADNIIPNQMTNNITVDGAEDPSLFAESLLRTFKLNARTT